MYALLFALFFSLLFMFFSKPRDFLKKSERLSFVASNSTFTEVFAKTTIMNFMFC